MINKEKQIDNTKFEDELFNNDTEVPKKSNQDEIEMNLNNMNDDFSDSGYMNRNFETNLDEIFENLNYFLTTEKKRIKAEKETLNKTIQNFLEFNSAEKRKITKEQINYLKNKRIAIDMITNNDDIIDLDIGGTKFISTSRQTLIKYPNSILAKMFSTNKAPTHKGKIFIDRDSTAFLNMIYYLRNNKAPYFKDEKDLLNFQEELEYWQIPYKEKNKFHSAFTFDPEWCASTLSLEPSNKVIKKKNVLHGIVFCKPAMDAINNYIEFSVVIKTPARGKSHLFLGLVDKSKYKYENLISTFWKDSPSSFYWDIWSTKLIKTDENGVQVRSVNGYGCRCETIETVLGIKYDESDKSVKYFKNGIDLGVAFREVNSGMTPALDIWFEEGSVTIVSKADLEMKTYL